MACGCCARRRPGDQPEQLRAQHQDERLARERAAAAGARRGRLIRLALGGIKNERAAAAGARRGRWIRLALGGIKNKMLVLFCDCPWSAAAKVPVILEAHRFMLHEGIAGWAQLGYPIVAGGNPCQTERNWPQAGGG